MKWMRGYGTKLVWNLGFKVKSSHHPIIQYQHKTCPKRLQANPPKLEVTKQPNVMTKFYVLWTKKLSDVYVQCTIKSQ